MGLLVTRYSPNRAKINSASDAVIEKLRQCISGTPVEFLRTQKLKPEIQDLSQASRIELIYSLIDTYSKEVASESVCEQKEMKSLSVGCKSSECCKLKPDVFLYEKQRLAALPSSLNKHPEYCLFFDYHQRLCSIYQQRPFTCRVFINFENDAKYCTEACRDTKSLKNAIYMFIKPFLGPYSGPYIGT